MSIARGLDQEDVVHIHNGILLSHYKERNNGICGNTDSLEITMLSEVGQTVRTNIICYHLYVGSKKIWIQLLCRTENDFEKLSVTRWDSPQVHKDGSTHSNQTMPCTTLTKKSETT